MGNFFIRSVWYIQGPPWNTSNISLISANFFILEYGSELMSQQEFKQPMDRLSEQLLFQGQNKNLHSNNTTNDRFLQGAAGYCNFPNPASIKEGIARSNLLNWHWSEISSCQILIYLIYFIFVYRQSSFGYSGVQTTTGSDDDQTWW